MKKIYLKFNFIFFLIYCLEFGHASNKEDYEHQNIFSRKRKSDHQDLLRVFKKSKIEVITFDNHAIDLDQFEKVSLNYTQVPVIPEINNNVKAANLIKNGFIKIELGQLPAALLDYNEALKLFGISEKLTALAYIYRGLIKSKLHQFTEAILDYDLALAMPNISDTLKAVIFDNRAFAKFTLGQYEATISDYDQFLSIVEIDNYFKVAAYTNRGYAKAALGQTGDAILDIEEILKFKDLFSSQQLLLIYDKLILLYEEQLNKKKISLNLNIKKNSNFVWFDS